jgi:hypothetical protein
MWYVAVGQFRFLVTLTNCESSHLCYKLLYLNSHCSTNQEKRSGSVTSVQSEPPQTQETTYMDLDVDSDLTMAYVLYNIYKITLELIN